VGSPLGRILIAVLALVVAGALFLILREGDDDSSADMGTTAAQTTTTTAQAEEPEQEPDKPEPPESRIALIEVVDGEPVGGVAELEFTVGDRIRFVVESDVDEEIHLHGYDVYEAVKAGGSAEFDLPATIEGVFEAELHGAVVPVAEISVVPQ
jgi:hypothetical protein